MITTASPCHLVQPADDGAAEAVQPLVLHRPQLGNPRAELRAAIPRSDPCCHRPPPRFRAERCAGATRRAGAPPSRQMHPSSSRAGITIESSLSGAGPGLAVLGHGPRMVPATRGWLSACAAISSRSIPSASPAASPDVARDARHRAPARERRTAAAWSSRRPTDARRTAARTSALNCRSEWRCADAAAHVARCAAFSGPASASAARPGAADPGMQAVAHLMPRPPKPMYFSGRRLPPGMDPE